MHVKRWEGGRSRRHRVLAGCCRALFRIRVGVVGRRRLSRPNPAVDALSVAARFRNARTPLTRTSTMAARTALAGTERAAAATDGSSPVSRPRLTRADSIAYSCAVRMRAFLVSMPRPAAAAASAWHGRTAARRAAAADGRQIGSAATTARRRTASEGPSCGGRVAATSPPDGDDVEEHWRATAARERRTHPLHQRPARSPCTPPGAAVLILQVCIHTVVSKELWD